MREKKAHGERSVVKHARLRGARARARKKGRAGGCIRRGARKRATMPIIYSLVARGGTVLAEHASTTGNFAKVAQSILDKIPASNSKMSYVYDRCGPTHGRP